MQTVTGHLCSALGLLRGARTACSQAVSLALARRVGMASTRLGLAITRLARTLTRLCSSMALSIISRGILFGFLRVGLIIVVGQQAIQHSF